MRVPESLLKTISPLFWDVDPASLDFERHLDFIMGRVLVEGGWEAVQALRREVGDEQLAAFAARSGRRLDLQTRRFLEVVLNLEPKPCDSTSLNQLSDMPFRR